MRIPLSPLFFVMAGFAYVLQLIPVIGIFMMFAMAPFWSVVLINAGFVGFAVEFVVRWWFKSWRLSPAWLILPVAWFAGYAWFAAEDQRALADLRAEIAQTNAPVRIPFDPERQALVMVGGDSTAWFVQTYALPVIYERDRRAAPALHRSMRLVDRALCSEINDDPTLTKLGIRASVFYHHDSRIGQGRVDPRFCTLRLPDNPALPVVLVETEERRTTYRSLPVAEKILTVTMPDGTRHRLRGGHAQPLSRFPMPIMGCTLNSGGASWDCFRQFNRDRFSPLVMKSAGVSSVQQTLAKALGLKRVTPAERPSVDPAPARAVIAGTEDRLIAAQVANLDQLLADPTRNLDYEPFARITGRMDIILPRLDRIVTAIERSGLDRRGGPRTNTRHLQLLIRPVPPAAIAPYRFRLETLGVEGCVCSRSATGSVFSPHCCPNPNSDDGKQRETHDRSEPGRIGAPTGNADR